jgi:hypothetical protein
MLSGRSARLLLGLLILMTASLFVACVNSAQQARPTEPQPRVETQPPPTLPVLQPTPSPIAEVQTAALPPKLEELKEAVARVFAKAAAPDTEHNPNFVVGDFNGDGSEDLAIITKAGEGSLKEINSEFANWTLEDPNKIPIPGTRPANQMNPPVPVRAEKGDTLLAIIHGVGPKGWRNPEAKQTFLLKNGVGSQMASAPARTLMNSKDKSGLPPLRGDAIRETIHGKSGLLFWTGAKYAWYSPPSE